MSIIVFAANYKSFFCWDIGVFDVSVPEFKTRGYCMECFKSFHAVGLQHLCRRYKTTLATQFVLSRLSKAKILCMLYLLCILLCHIGKNTICSSGAWVWISSLVMIAEAHKMNLTALLQ